ncbi:MAG: Spi family protease inhibitor [Bacteroidales bacterium]|nr:Spi family protease inhibitor [Bacteroidales bacterium]
MNTTNSQAKGFATDKSSLQLTYTSTFNGNNTYYVFNKSNEEGYLILSADDCMPAVLGVVEGNSFDYDKLPDNMKWWLSQYDVSISNYSAKGRKYVSSSTAKRDIEPLLGDIQWNQWWPPSKRRGKPSGLYLQWGRFTKGT